MSSRPSKFSTPLFAANVLGAGAATAFAVIGVIRPGFGQPGSAVSSRARFWAASSAVRTLALTGPLLVGAARGKGFSPELLLAAGIVQLLDAGLGVQQRNPSMAVLPAAMGAVHLASARALRPHRRRVNGRA